MKEVKNEYVKFWMEDGILYNEFTKPVSLSEEVVKELIELRHAISNNEKQYWCYNFNGVTSMPKNGRDYAELHGQDFLSASAAIINSHITNFIVNTFTLIKKPHVSFKAFKTKESGVKWLLDVKKQNELKNL